MFDFLRLFVLPFFFCIFRTGSLLDIAAIMSAPSVEASQAAPPPAEEKEQEQRQHDEKTVEADAPAEARGPTFNRGYQFWAIMIALCTVGVLGALENTVVTTSLPTIVKNLHIGQDYIWITNIFFLMRYAVLCLNVPEIQANLDQAPLCSHFSDNWPIFSAGDGFPSSSWLSTR